MGFGTTFTNGVSKLVKRFTRTADNAVEDPAGPNQDAANFADRELKEGAAESSKSFSSEASKQARKRVFKGGEINRPERWGMEQMHKLFDLAEKFRNWITKAWKPAKVALAVGAAAGIASVAAMFAGPAPQRDPPPDIDGSNSGYVVDIDIPPPLPDFSPLPADLALSGDEFDAMVGRLDISSLSLEALGRERVYLDTSDLPPAMPPLVAAAAAAPVAVSTRQGDAIRSGTTTVQQFYEAMPEAARDQIEERLRENGGSGLHVDINVGTDFANIRIKG